MHAHDVTGCTQYLAFELGNLQWKLALTSTIEQPPLARQPCYGPHSVFTICSWA